VAKYHIEELRNGLRVTVRREFEALTRLLVSGLAGAITGMGTATVFGGWWWAACSPIAALIGFASVRSQNAELQATKVELVARGDLGRRTRKRIVYTGDVRRLEYREPSLQFGGLYAVTASSEYCVLPFLDYAQTTAVILAIETRFPGLAEQWRTKTKNTEPLLTY
jgi:hypothetical protein